jgi:hypothetical protein
MARQRKPVSRPLTKVKAGDVFAMPLADGRWGACRVLRLRADPLAALVATSSWIGTAPPELTEPRLVDVLRLTHHSWDGGPHLCWVNDPVPPELVHLGALPPTAKQARAKCEAHGDWDSCSVQALLQWRWDHEREAVLAEDEAAREKERGSHEAARRAYKPLSKATLDDLRKRPFKGWEGFVEPEQLRAARKVIRDTLDALLALGLDAPEPLKINLFHRAVERFNQIDYEGDGWICTIEREDICELLDDLADLVGLEEYDDALTGRRDW